MNRKDAKMVSFFMDIVCFVVLLFVTVIKVELFGMLAHDLDAAVVIPNLGEVFVIITRRIEYFFHATVAFLVVDKP